jgi:hypothetical protein
MTDIQLSLEEIKTLLNALRHMPLSKTVEALEVKLTSKYEVLKMFSNDHSPTRDSTE